MIRNNLAILMSERGIKNSFLSAKTGISKNTISATASNEGKMIQLETINKICHVLEVSPCEFFSYLPYDVEIKVFPEDMVVQDLKVGTDEIGLPILQPFITNIKLDVFMSKVSLHKTIDFNMTGILQSQVNLFKNEPPHFTISFDGENSEQYTEFWRDIPTPFQKDIEKSLREKIYKELQTYIMDYPDSHDFNSLNNFKSYVDTILSDMTISIEP